MVNNASKLFVYQLMLFFIITYFVTCDDILIKKAKRMKKQIRIEVCNPLEFVLKEVL